MTKKISGFDAATTPLDGTETFEVVQGGVNVKATTQDVADLAVGANGTFWLWDSWNGLDGNGVAYSITDNAGDVMPLTTLVDANLARSSYPSWLAQEVIAEVPTDDVLTIQPGLYSISILAGVDVGDLTASQVFAIVSLPTPDAGFYGEAHGGAHDDAIVAYTVKRIDTTFIVPSATAFSIRHYASAGLGSDLAYSRVLIIRLGDVPA